MRYFPQQNIIGQERYLVQVALQAGYVVPTCDHQSIKEFTSIKNKMTITPVIYCRVNIYGRYGEMPGILHSYQPASKLFFHPTIVLLSITIFSLYNIQRNTQNFRFQECFNIIMFAKSWQGNAEMQQAN